MSNREKCNQRMGKGFSRCQLEGDLKVEG